MKATSPVVLFVYNRLWHTMQTIDALKRNKLASDTDLYIFSDGAKKKSDEETVKDVRKYLTSISGFRNVHLIKRSYNFGLAKSIIAGVGEIVNKYGRVIVLEDDLVTSPFFLDFMNKSLDYYENEEKVISIHGYIYPVQVKLPQTFFLRGADCWGWATWRRGWNLFENDGSVLLRKLKESKLTDIFDFNRTYPYTNMLENQVLGKNDSWAIRWYASAFLNEKLTLYPGTSLVSNIGMDGSGTNCEETIDFNVNLGANYIKVGSIQVIESLVARKAIETYFNQLRGTIFGRILGKLRSTRDLFRKKITSSSYKTI